MLKVKKMTSSIVGRLLCIGFLIQIGMGLIWANQFIKVPFSGEERAYLEFALSGFTLDRNGGIFYPWLIRTFLSSSGITGECVKFILFLQFFLAFCAISKMLRVFRIFQERTFLRLLGIFSVLTVPVIMQALLQIQPAAVTGSFLLLFLADITEGFSEILAITKKTEQEEAMATLKKRTKAPGVMLLLLTLQCPVLLIPAFWVYLPLLVMGFCNMPKQENEKSEQTTSSGFVSLVTGPLLLLLICIGIFIALFHYSGEKEMRPGIWEVAFERVAWTGFVKNESRWPGELVEILGEEQMRHASREAAFVRLEVMPAVKTALGTEQADALYRNLIGVARKYYANDLLHDLIIDGAGGVCPPIVSSWLISGKRYESYALGNYAHFCDAMPEFARLYWDYSFYWFAFCLAEMVLVEIVRSFRRIVSIIRKKTFPRLWEKDLLPGVLSAYYFLLVMCCLSVLQGCGVQDYRTNWFQSSIWIFLMLNVLWYHWKIGEETE